MKLFVLQSGLALLTLLGLLRVMAPRARPVSLLLAGLRSAVTSRAGRRGLAALTATAAAGYLLNRVDPWFTELALRLHGVEDFAAWIYALEGGFTRSLQAWAPRPAIAFFLYVYVSFFPALYAATLLALFHLGHGRLVRAGTAALILNPVLAIPFFAFFPVRETWYSRVAPAELKARLLIEELWPGLEPLFRDLRGIENNFPSLHTAVAATAALLAWRSGSRRLAGVCGAGAALVVFSTLYLGFHWATDALAGCAHAALCTALALRIVSAGAGDVVERGRA